MEKQVQTRFGLVTVTEIPCEKDDSRRSRTKTILRATATDFPDYFGEQTTTESALFDLFQKLAIREAREAAAKMQAE